MFFCKTDDNNPEYIDIHTHILPGLDDGAVSIGQSLLMARKAVKTGTRVMIATPHTFDGIYDVSTQEILEACRSFNNVLKKNAIPLSVLPGAENRLSQEFIEATVAGEVMTLGGRGTHILVELPNLFIVPGIIRLLEQLVDMGLTPVIAHPERNSVIQSDPRIIGLLRMSGAQIQITAGSLMGKQARQVKKFLRHLLASGGVDYIATDAHDIRHRDTDLGGCRKQLSKIVGMEMADAVLFENAVDWLLPADARVTGLKIA